MLEQRGKIFRRVLRDHCWFFGERSWHDLYLILFTLTPAQCQRIIEALEVRRSQAKKTFVSDCIFNAPYDLRRPIVRYLT
jgi:hypothetical protein